MCFTVLLEDKAVFKCRESCSLWDGRVVCHCVVGRQGRVWIDGVNTVSQKCRAVCDCVIHLKVCRTSS